MKSVKRRFAAAMALFAMAVVPVSWAVPQQQSDNPNNALVARDKAVPADVNGLCDPDDNCSYALLSEVSRKS
jgi:hypothetical protein